MKVETKEKLEEWAKQNLDALTEDSLTLEGIEERSKQAQMSLAILKEIEEAEAKAKDAEERTRIDKMKTEAMIQIEKQKQKFSWSHFLADCGKTLGMTIVSFELYKKLQAILLEFEKTGRVTSSAGHQLKLPDWKWRF